MCVPVEYQYISARSWSPATAGDSFAYVEKFSDSFFVVCWTWNLLVRCTENKHARMRRV